MDLPLFAQRVDALAREQASPLCGVVNILMDPMVEQWDPNRFDHDPLRARISNVAMGIANITTILEARRATDDSGGRTDGKLNQLWRVRGVNDRHASSGRKRH